MLTCIFGLTACGGETKTLKYDESVIAEQCVNTYALVSGEFTEEEIAAISEYNDDEMDALAEEFFAQTGIKTEGEVMLSGIESFENSLDIIGEYNDKEIGNNMVFEASEDRLIVNVPIYGSKHEGYIEIIYDKNLHITSITTNVKYSLPESMKKAGVNTAIGMGSVFTMLILIMIIIYCFGVIPKIQKSLEDKKNSKKKENESVDNAIQNIVEREEIANETDDLELVAVIAAAIAASEGASSTDGFVVRSIRRIR